MFFNNQESQAQTFDKIIGIQFLSVDVLWRWSRTVH